MFVSAHAVFGKFNVVSRRRTDNEREPRRIGAVFFYHVEGIDDVPERFRHFAPLRVANETVQIHLLERNVAEEKPAHQYHACHPEKDDVIAGLQDRCRMVRFQIFCFFRPTKRRKCPQSRGEPCVEHVRVLLPSRAGRLKTDLHFFALVPRRDTMSEPNLPRDAPVTEIIYPVIVDAFEPFRRDFYVTPLDSLPHPRFQRHLAFRAFERLVYRDEPLPFYLRFDNAAAAAIRRHIVHVLLVYFRDKPFLLQFLDDSGTRFLNVLSCKFTRDGEKDAALINDLLYVETVFFCDVEVVHVVRGRDGHRARAERHINAFVLDDGRSDGAVNPFQFHVLSMLVFLVALIIRMHHDVLIAEFRFRTHGRDNERTILKVVERVGLLDIFNLVVRDGRLQFRVPVHYPVAAVDEPCFVHTHERLHNGGIPLFIHRVRVAAPIERRAHFLELIDDGRLAFVGEHFDALQ